MSNTLLIKLNNFHIVDCDAACNYKLDAILVCQQTTSQEELTPVQSFYPTKN